MDTETNKEPHIMVAIASLLVVLVLSLLVVRVATVALTLTGLSRELARFQARSAFTGSGFTTGESEKVVQHPVRRRIILLLMLLGNAGIISVVSTLILSFVDTSGVADNVIYFRIAVLSIGMATLWTLAHSHWVDHQLSGYIAWALKRWTDLDIRDYAGLLHLSGDYAVVELSVQPEDWLCQRALAELKLADEGVLVLGIEKPDGNYLGAPRGPTELSGGDTLLLYGPREVLENLDERRRGATGNWEHHKAVDRQRQVESRELESQTSAAQTEA